MSFAHGHALVIGIGQYQVTNLDVPIAVKDAEAVSAALRDPIFCGYPSQQVTLLISQAATRQAVLNAFDELTIQLKVEETLFLFFVGHGAYGTDGNYYLLTHDSQLQGNRVVAGTGVSENDLIDKLRAIQAKRILIIINSCHSGELSPNFGTDNDTFESELPPAKLTDAVLSTGEGRITITACRSGQKSWIGDGNLSIFSQALVNGLQGAVSNNRGYISAFDLYEYLYFEAKAAAAKLGWEQEPELTVIKGVGPFPVALYRGATQLGDFDTSATSNLEGTAVREVSREMSQRIYNRYQATLNGNGAIANAPGANAVGQGGILINGDVSGNITMENNNYSNSK